MARERQRVRLVRDGVTQSLTEIVSDLPKVENRAMREGAKFFAEKLEQNTPVGPDPRPPNKYGPNTPYSTTRLKEDVKWQKRGQGRYGVGRSEERRVGKECRSRCGWSDYKKKKQR